MSHLPADLGEGGTGTRNWRAAGESQPKNFINFVFPSVCAGCFFVVVVVLRFCFVLFLFPPPCFFNSVMEYSFPVPQSPF